MNIHFTIENIQELEDLIQQANEILQKIKDFPFQIKIVESPEQDSQAYQKK